MSEQNSPSVPRYQSTPISPILIFSFLSFLAGVWLTVAIGKTDVDKAIWFTAGIAVSAISVAIQASETRKRAAEEREFKRAESIREHTTTARNQVYDAFLQCCADTINADISDNSLVLAMTTHARVRVVGEKQVADKCLDVMEFFAEWKKVRDGKLEPALVNGYTYYQRYGALIATMSNAMRLDLGKDTVEVRP